MPTGVIINSVAIVIGGLAGSILKEYVDDSFK